MEDPKEEGGHEMGMEEEKGPRTDRNDGDNVVGVTAEYARGRKDAEDAVNNYANATHVHVGVFQCWQESGDRCDITAALRVAARYAGGWGGNAS